MEIKSKVFSNNEHIPSKYTCDGQNISPELEFLNVPENTKSLVLILDDPDAVSGTFTHWVIFNIDPETKLIAENSLPKGLNQGLNSGGRNSYIGPCPPSGTHRYFFKLYALDIKIPSDVEMGKVEVESAMAGHVIEEARLIGLYGRT
jgi:Raf kinase inhibitor-like YbhB/YbcL family protein